MIRHSLAAALALTLAATAPAVFAAEDDIAARLAAADPAVGEKVFRKCKACHTVEKDGGKRVGPNLWGVLGREVAGVTDYAYSVAFAGHGGEWTPARLDDFLADPRGEVPGTKMTFSGLKDADDRAALIAWLNTMSDTPRDLSEAAPAVVAAADDSDEEGGAAAAEFGVLKIADGVETTYYACTACHSEMIVAQQGLSRLHWDELLVWMVEEQGMTEPSPEDREVILDYLSEHYGEDRPNFPR